MKYKQYMVSLSTVIGIILVIVCICSIGAATAVEPHAFAIALQEFFAGATSGTSSVLADLDGDGVDELVALRITENEQGESLGRLAIFSEKNSPIYVDDEFFYEVSSIFISNKNYIVETGEGGDCGWYKIYEYSSGSTNDVMLTNRAGTGQFEYEFTRDGDTSYITKNQFENYLSSYAATNAKKVLYGYTATDETLKILVMTASVSVSSALKVNSTASIVLVNGISTNFEAYNINGNNYFKLRDLAFAINGTEKQFDVGWDSVTKAITLTSGVAYTAVGGEMKLGDGMPKSATLNTDIIISRNGTPIEITAYLIGGNNFVKLRDVMRLFDISVTWDGTNNKIGIDTSIPYED